MNKNLKFQLNEQGQSSVFIENSYVSFVKNKVVNSEK